MSFCANIHVKSSLQKYYISLNDNYLSICQVQFRYLMVFFTTNCTQKRKGCILLKRAWPYFYVKSPDKV